MIVYRFKTARIVHHIPRQGPVYEYTSKKAAEEKREELMDSGWYCTVVHKVRV